MSTARAAAQANYDRAKDHYEYWLKARFGIDWEAHTGDYSYDMSACIGRTFFRGMHDAALALAATKSAEHE